MTGNWYSGNAADDGKDTRGWVLGQFIDTPQDVRSSKDVEVNWGIHPQAMSDQSGLPMTSARRCWCSWKANSASISPRRASR